MGGCCLCLAAETAPGRASGSRGCSAGSQKLLGSLRALAMSSFRSRSSSSSSRASCTRDVLACDGQLGRLSCSIGASWPRVPARGYAWPCPSSCGTWQEPSLDRIALSPCCTTLVTVRLKHRPACDDHAQAGNPLMSHTQQIWSSVLYAAALRSGIYQYWARGMFCMSAM